MYVFLFFFFPHEGRWLGDQWYDWYISRFFEICPKLSIQNSDSERVDDVFGEFNIRHAVNLAKLNESALDSVSQPNTPRRSEPLSARDLRRSSTIPPSPDVTPLTEPVMFFFMGKGNIFSYNLSEFRSEMRYYHSWDILFHKYFFPGSVYWTKTICFLFPSLVPSVFESSWWTIYVLLMKIRWMFVRCCCCCFFRAPCIFFLTCR